MAFFTMASPANGSGYQIQDARAYTLEKLAAHDIVFMGTTHKQPAVLAFVSDILPQLYEAGITHIAIEVASDQQDRIDRYIASGEGLAEIELHQAIECPHYRQLFVILRKIDPSQRPQVVAIDLPVHQFNDSVSRDAYMAGMLEGALRSHPKGKILTILGSFHVLRQLQWQKRIANGHQAIRTLLSKQQPDLEMFSMAHVLSRMDSDCDFSRRLGAFPGTVAVDLDIGFDQWHLGLTASLAIKPAPARKILDGLIIH